MKNWYSIKAKAKDAEVWIYEEIGDYWDSGVSSKQFAKDLKDIGPVDTITVHLNSPGGIVWDGIAIYNLLKQHAAKVIVSIEGLAASIASVIAMAGDETRMAENAMMMIHDPWGVAVGSAEDMRKTADAMDKVKDSILAAYVAKCGGKTKEKNLSEMMAVETWLSAQEAMECGLVDSITDELQIAASFDLSKFKFKKIPEQFVKAENTDMRQRLAAMSIKTQRIRAACGPQGMPAS